MVKKWVSVIVIFSFLCVLLTGCATIMHGTTQNVGFSSNPTGAVVCIDNKECGKTPHVFHLSRNKNHIVKLEMKGYEPYETTLTKSVSGWVWGNIVIGGLIGLAVDAVSGGIYKLEPEQIQGKLKQTKTAFSKNTLFLQVVLVPKANPKWVKIGQLTPTHSIKLD